MTETPRKRISWSHWDRFLFILLGIVLALVLGLSLWFHELDQTPNVAVPTAAPLADNAFGYYKAAGDAVVDDSKISEAISSQLSPPPGTTRPLPKPSGPGVRPGFGGRPGYGGPPAAGDHFYSLIEKTALVAENAGAVEILHAGFRYPYQEPPARSFRATFPQYAKMRALARLLSLRAQVQSARGDWNGAIGSDLDSIQMGEEMPHGGPMIGMLVGAACQAIGRRPAWSAVDHLDAAQAKAAARRLEGIRADHVPFADTLQEEEWEGQASLLEMMRQRDWPGNLMAISTPGDDGESTTWQQRGLMIRVRLTGKRAILSNYTRYLDQAVVNARQPYAAHVADPLMPTDPLSQIMLPVYDKVRAREVCEDAQNALLVMVLALRAYRLEHGTYPATLSALAPTYFKAVPADPFALSGLLRYKRSTSGYLLYSIGPDGKDDGGKAIFDTTHNAPAYPGATDPRRYVLPDSQGDIVAGVNVN